ncbi:MAG: hypothetical protein U0S12_08735 [Fimbriimonadales bacterium]
MPRPAPDDRDEAAVLAIRRNSPKDCTYRVIHVYVDEELLATLNWNDSFVTKVKPGLHTVTVDNTWTSKSQTIAFEPHEHLGYVVGNTVNGCFLTLLMTIGVSPMGIFLDPDVA